MPSILIKVHYSSCDFWINTDLGTSNKGDGGLVGEERKKDDKIMYAPQFS
jgi:hypothetical protein